MAAVRRVLIAVLLALLCCSGADVPNLDSSGATIVCFGDSITAGVGRGKAPSYPEVLADELGTRVINVGAPGETSVQGLARLDEALAHDPWLVIVELGGNDLLRQIPLEATEEALSEILERILDAGAVPMLLEIHGPLGGRYEDLFARLGKRYRVPVVTDLLPSILIDRRLKSDPIHPNGAGYRRLGEGVAEAIRPLMKRREDLR